MLRPSSHISAAVPKLISTTSTVTFLGCTEGVLSVSRGPTAQLSTASSNSRARAGSGAGTSDSDHREGYPLELDLRAPRNTLTSNRFSRSWLIENPLRSATSNDSIQPFRQCDSGLMKSEPDRRTFGAHRGDSPVCMILSHERKG